MPIPKVVSPTPLIPGKPTQFLLRLLPTSYVFPAGHRIRLAIAGGADIGVGEDGRPQSNPAGPGKNPNAFRVTVFEDKAHPSVLEVPIIGTAWQQWEEKHG
jgi:hypothetical protein